MEKMQTIYSWINKLSYQWPLMAICLISLGLTSCFKDFKEDYLFRDNVVEFDLSTWESPAPGKTYPIIGPLAKGSGIQTFQVNLLGEQKDTPITLQYRVVSDETTAAEGTHFKLVDNGTFTIEANSSTGQISVEILDFLAETGADTLVLELIGGNGVEVSENYKRLGIAISLVGPPDPGSQLHIQLGPDNFYNSIFIDMMNPDLPSDVRQAIESSAANLANHGDGSRRLQNMYLYFDRDDMVRVVARYFGGGGNSLVADPYAVWVYKMELDDQGVGRLEFVESQQNGGGQRANFAPILADYLEKYEFRVDWADPAIAPSPREGVMLGGLFRTDNPNSFILGSLENLDPDGSSPYPQSPVVHELFSDGTEGGYYTTLYIDPDDPAQSSAFKTQWDAGKVYIEGLAGRQLHKMMFYFNPTFNFQDIQLVNYYYSSAGGKFLGQVRFQFNVDFEGNVQPLEFIFQNGNGGATRAPQIVDNLLMTTEFKMTRTGDRVRFTSNSDSNMYFEGVLGNRPLSTSDWPE